MDIMRPMILVLTVISCGGSTPVAGDGQTGRRFQGPGEQSQGADVDPAHAAQDAASAAADARMGTGDTQSEETLWRPGQDGPALPPRDARDPGPADSSAAPERDLTPPPPRCSVPVVVFEACITPGATVRYRVDPVYGLPCAICQGQGSTVKYGSCAPPQQGNGVWCVTACVSCCIKRGDPCISGGDCCEGPGLCRNGQPGAGSSAICVPRVTP